MSTNLQKALELAVQYKCDYENSNPEVGFGPSASGVVLSVLQEADLDRSGSVNIHALEAVATEYLR